MKNKNIILLLLMCILLCACRENVVIKEPQGHVIEITEGITSAVEATTSTEKNIETIAISEPFSSTENQTNDSKPTEAQPVYTKPATTESAATSVVTQTSEPQPIITEPATSESIEEPQPETEGTIPPYMTDIG